MRHFHVIRWNPVGVSTGENITVPDVDYASVSSSAETLALLELTRSRGERCSAYQCSDLCCTLHGPRATGRIALGRPSTAHAARA